jgi:hypothetical protein
MAGHGPLHQQYVERGAPGSVLNIKIKATSVTLPLQNQMAFIMNKLCVSGLGFAPNIVIQLRPYAMLLIPLYTVND